jgi:hypothetical protein
VRAQKEELNMDKQDGQDLLLRLFILSILPIHVNKRNYFVRLAVKSRSPNRSLCTFPFMESPAA